MNHLPKRASTQACLPLHLLAARIASDRADSDDLALAILRLPQGDILRRIPLVPG